MILLTGDIHGDVRSPLWVIQRHGLTTDDLLILLGGLVKTEDYSLERFLEVLVAFKYALHNLPPFY